MLTWKDVFLARVLAYTHMCVYIKIHESFFKKKTNLGDVEAA